MFGGGLARQTFISDEPRFEWLQERMFGQQAGTPVQSEHHSTFLNNLRQGWTYSVIPAQQHSEQNGITTPVQPQLALPHVNAALEFARRGDLPFDTDMLFMRACQKVIVHSSDGAGFSAPSQTDLSEAKSTTVQESLASQLQDVPADFLAHGDAAAVLCTAIVCADPDAVLTVLEWLPDSHLASNDFSLKPEHSSAAPWLEPLAVNSTPWHVAASVPTSDAILSALAGSLRPASVQQLDADGLSALHVAAREGNTGTLEALLRLPDVDANMLSAQGAPPLLLAVMGCHLPCVEALLQGGGDPWWITHGSTHTAPSANTPRPLMGLGCLSLALSLGPSEPSMFGVLLTAAQRRVPEHALGSAPTSIVAGDASSPDFERTVRERVLQHALASPFTVEGAYDRPRTESLLCVAARHGVMHHIQLLLEAVPVHAWQQQLQEHGLSPGLPLLLALEAGHTDAVQQLLSAGMQPSPDVDLVTTAVQVQDDRLLQALIDAGASLNTAHGTCPALAVCLQRDDVRMARLLLAAGARALSGEAPAAADRYKQYGTGKHTSDPVCASALHVWDPSQGPLDEVPPVLALILRDIAPGSVHPDQLPLVHGKANAVKWSAPTAPSALGVDGVASDPSLWGGIVESAFPPRSRNTGDMFHDETPADPENGRQPWWGTVPPSHPMHLSNLRRLCRPLSDFFPRAETAFALLRQGGAAVNPDAVEWALGPELDLFGTPEDPRDIDVMGDPELHQSCFVASLGGYADAVVAGAASGHASFQTPENCHLQYVMQAANPSTEKVIYNPPSVTDYRVSGFERLLMPWMLRGDLGTIARLNGAVHWWYVLLSPNGPPPTPEEHAEWNARRYARARAAAQGRAHGILAGSPPWVPRAQLLVEALRCMCGTAAAAYAACKRMASSGLLQRSFAPMCPPAQLLAMENPFTWDITFPMFVQNVISQATRDSRHEWYMGVLQWLAEGAGVALTRAVAADLRRAKGANVVRSLTWMRRRRFVLMRQPAGSLQQAAPTETVPGQLPATSSAAADGRAARDIQWPAAYHRHSSDGTQDSVVLLLNRHSPQQWRLYMYAAGTQRRMTHRRPSDSAVKGHFMSLPADEDNTFLQLFLRGAQVVSPAAGSDLHEDMCVLQAAVRTTAQGDRVCDVEL